MKRPNKKDYLTTNQIEYDLELNKYYEELEKYVDYLELIKHSSISFAEAATLANIIPIDQAEQKIKSYLTKQPITVEIKGELKVIIE